MHEVGNVFSMMSRLIENVRWYVWHHICDADKDGLVSVVSQLLGMCDAEKRFVDEMKKLS